jgi:hypothetical protein
MRGWRWIIAIPTLMIVFASAKGMADTNSAYSHNAFGLALLLFFLLVPLCITVHELGHAAAAVLTGRRVHMIVVSPIGYQSAKPDSDDETVFAAIEAGSAVPDYSSLHKKAPA